MQFSIDKCFVILPLARVLNIIQIVINALYFFSLFISYMRLCPTQRDNIHHSVYQVSVVFMSFFLHAWGGGNAILYTIIAWIIS